VTVNLPVELRFHMGAPVVGHVRNVSREGVLAELDVEQAAGTLVRLRVQAADLAEPLLAVGVVVRRVESPRGLGICLTSTSEAWDRFWDDLTARLRSGTA
jgi:hypothetical protein